MSRIVAALGLLLLLSTPGGAQTGSSAPGKEYRGFLIDMECNPLRDAQKPEAAVREGTPPLGCGASSNTTRYGLYMNGRVARFDEDSNRVMRTLAETNSQLKYAMVNNAAGQPRLRVAATGKLQGDVLSVSKVRRLNRLTDQANREQR